MEPLLTSTEAGLYCPRGDFYVDPWKPVGQAVLTHAHADHALPGSDAYLCAAPGVSIVQKRLPEARVQGVPYGAPLRLKDAQVSFHAAGHVLGSAQIRVEVDGQVWVISGDYKRQADPTCAPFEVVPCDVFVTEATFGLPVYRWDPPEVVARDILAWWDRLRAQGRTAVLFCYTLGKAQRILAELAKWTDRTVQVHGAVEEMTELFRAAGVTMLPTLRVVEQARGHSFAGELVLAPLSARGTPWMRRFADFGSAFASGWMRVRGERRRRNLERGFVLSDHADFPALLDTVRATGAREVLVTHGYTEQLARHLRELGMAARVLETRFEGEPRD